VDLQGKVALVTGASSGIGYATAVLLAQQGASVAAHYYATPQGAERAVSTITEGGGRAFTVRANVSERTEVKRMFDEVASKEGRLDILVNNAGDLIERCPIAEMTDDLFDRIVTLNFRSVFFCCQAALKRMLPQRSGTIVNVTSISGRNGGGPGAVVYAAAKGAVLTFSKGLAREVASCGIRVNAVAPGVIATRFHERHSNQEVLARFVSSVPLGRAGTADEVAEVIVFLASRRSAYLVGETIEVNGGQLMD